MLKQKQKILNKETSEWALIVIWIVSMLVAIFMQYQGFMLGQELGQLTTPQISPVEVGEDVGLWPVSAYNAGDPNQTDDSPCISANGEDICKAIAKGFKRCAANQFPLGTLLKIENYGECLVVDRTAERFSHRIDIAMAKNEKARALNFGVQRLNVWVLTK